MGKIVIVGSGASGVHFALSLLKKGYNVQMLDVGFKSKVNLNPNDSLPQLKENLDDPVEYFLGKNFEGIVFPDAENEYYGFPPSKNFVFEGISNLQFNTKGFNPLLSFAQGGLAEAWTAGSYSFNDHDLTDFPFGYEDIQPFYNEIADRIGMVGEEDDLARFFPMHRGLQSPLKLDEHSQTILMKYGSSKDYLNKALRCYIGRSRIAVLSNDRNGRKKCAYLGRCIWGCPIKAFYTPSITLEQCKQFPEFDYVSGVYATHFKFDNKRNISAVFAEEIKNGNALEFKADRFVLAAGTLATGKIYLESIYRNTGEIIKLTGLMDNRQVLVPFLNLKMIGRNYDPNTYQYHQLAIGFENDDPRKYIHGQITTLKTALIHPIVQSMPANFPTSLFLFKNIRAALGVINIMFPDHRREENFLTLQKDKKEGRSKLVINYSPKKDEKKKLDKTIKKVKKALRKLDCIIPPGMIHVRPMGASVHYAGTIPMSTSNSLHTSNSFCQSNEFKNLYFADGTTYPFLPSKNLTFTLMANAARVAECMF